MDKLFLLFLAHSLGMWVAFWVYDDARQRYPGRIWAIGWAASVYFLLVVFLWFYLLLRPPKVFENIPKLAEWIKILIYLVAFPLMLILLLILAVVTKQFS